MTSHPLDLDAEQLRTHTSRLRALARVLVRDEHTADDLVQDAWVTALHRPVESGWTLASWLNGILRNQARRHARTERRRLARESAVSAPGDGREEDSLERFDLLQDLMVQIRGLEEPYRSTILLRFFDGLSPCEVAERQGVPLETMRTRLKRAVAQLRARMDAAHGGDRRAWLVPLVPFAAVPDPVATATLAEGALELANRGAPAWWPAVTSKPVLAVVSVAMTAVLLATLWPDAPEPSPDQIPAAVAPAASESTDSGVPTDTPARADTGELRRELVESGDRRAPETAGAVRVEGVVRSVDGSPLEGVKVALNRDDVTTTGRDGTYSLVARSIQRAESTQSGGWQLPARITASLKGYASRLETVWIRSQGGVRCDFELRRGFVAAGRVVDADGRAISGAWVVQSELETNRTKTDAEGRFRLDTVDPGRVHAYLHARTADGLEGGTVFTMTGVAERTDLEIELRPAPERRPVAASPHISTVTGIVVDPSGRAIDAAVEVYREDTRIAAQPVDRTGRFELRDLPTGPLTLVGKAQGYVEQWVHPIQARDLGVLTLHRRARVAGIVVDRGTGQPLTQFTVRISQFEPAAAEERRFVGAEGGAWEVEDSRIVLGEKFDVEVRAPGYAPALREALVARAELQGDDYRFELEPGTGLEGSVSGSRGRFVAHALVRIARRSWPLDLRAEHLTPWSTRTDALGRFSLADLGPGAHWLIVEHPDCGLFVRELHIPQGVPKWSESVLVHAQAKLTGTLQRADGGSVEKALVTLVSVEVPGIRNYGARCPTDSTGSFRFEHIAPGRYQVHAEALDPAGTRCVGESEVVVGAAGEQTLQLSVEPVRDVRDR